MPSTRRPTTAALAWAAVFLLASGLFQYFAWLHWQTLFPLGGKICGQGQSAHCAWCYASPAAAAAGLLVLVAPGLRGRHSLAKSREIASK